MRQFAVLTVVFAVTIALGGVFASTLPGPSLANHLCPSPAPTPPEPASCGMTAMSVDMNTTGNTSLVVATIENCARILENGVQDPGESGIDQVSFDVTAQGVPPFNNRGN